MTEKCPNFDTCKRYFEGTMPIPKKCYDLKTALLCGIISAEERERFLRKRRIEKMEGGWK